MRYQRLLLLLLMILFSFSTITESSFGLRIESCFHEELGEEVLCRTYEVMENRQVRKGAKIRLNFIILPAWTETPALDPISIFTGGPGVGSAAWAYYHAQDYEKLRWEREIVLVDQRGTGQSNPLHCRRLGDPDSAQTYLQDMFPEDYVKECRKELEKRANLRYYHSTIAMQDIDDLRAALGYEQINIAGTSYGSYAGSVYMKYFPERVRCAFLTHIAMPNWTYAATIAPNTEAALERLFADCAADPDCAADYPDVRQKLAQVIYRLKQGPVSVPIINPITGGPETVTFTHNNFIHGLRSMLYGTSASRWIPAFIHWAAEGYFPPIVEYTADYLYWINIDIMDGMFLCVTCAESILYINYAEARAQAEGTLMGTYRLDQQVDACKLWVRGDHPDDFRTFNAMGISTLIVSGEIDPTTPPELGEELASYLPYSLHVIIPNEGHSFGQVWENCLDDVVAQFISQGFVEGLDPSCVNENQRPPFVSWRDYVGDNAKKITSDSSNLARSPRDRYRKLKSKHR
ncbi:MAG: alpha/beta fold hydrolase [Candidatus Aminicenantes bacterium]|nr:MAG: alpha/beta fold hydrolase [Candidatus Aminicenantes bacterium]